MLAGRGAKFFAMEPDMKLRITSSGLSVILGLALVIAAALPARAQTVTGTIQGTITDTSGAVLPGVTITIKQVDPGPRGAPSKINGVNNADSWENQNRQGAALSTIQEFQVLKSSYSAEFGRGDGAVVLVQTKSGTNKMHGDVYLYQQDGAWNAKSF